MASGCTLAQRWTAFLRRFFSCTAWPLVARPVATRTISSWAVLLLALWGVLGLAGGTVAMAQPAPAQPPQWQAMTT